MDNLIYWLVLIIILLVINNILIKYSFCLDNPVQNEKHKLLLGLENKVPLSGFFFFVPIIFFLFYKYNQNVVLTTITLFSLGFLSDIKLFISPRLRLLFQFFIILIFVYLTDTIVIDTRINAFNSLMTINIFRILLITFFFLVLINGFNFIDGTNNLCSLNFLIVLAFIGVFYFKFGYFEKFNQIILLIQAVIVFTIFNFFGKNFMGDGGVYGLSFFIGYTLTELSILEPDISPYFVANLLWYPAFENLFSIVRRIFLKKKNYLPDNDHLHQLLYKFMSKKIHKKKYIISSLCGITINSMLIISYILGYFYYSETHIQVIIILVNIILYSLLYLKMKKILND